MLKFIVLLIASLILSSVLSFSMNFEPNTYTDDLKNHLDAIFNSLEQHNHNFPPREEWVPQIYELVEKGANPAISSEIWGTALHFAAVAGDLKLIKFLLDKGLDVNIKSVYGTTTALHLLVAIINTFKNDGQQEAIDMLMSFGAALEVERYDDSGWTPLMNAVLLNYQALAAKLISWGANVEAKDMHHRSVLELCQPRAKKLIRCFIPGEQEPPLEKTLHKAVRNDEADKVLSILGEGINNTLIINEVDEFGHTPLYIALVRRNYPIIKLLLENNADPLQGSCKTFRLARCVSNEDGFQSLYKQVLYNPLLKCWISAEIFYEIFPRELCVIIISIFLELYGNGINSPPAISTDYSNWMY